MTTIAFKGTTMAADTQVSGGGAMWATVKKIRKVDGYLIGGCGDLDVLHWFLTKFRPEWIEKKVQPALPSGVQVKDNEFEGLIVGPNRQVYTLSEKLLITPIKIKQYISCGSGEPVANGAMAVGANAIEAIRAAMKHDANTGGRVHFIRL